MKVALAGGGTGGHVFPAVSIVEELKRRDPNLQLMYIGKAASVEERIAGEMMIPFRSIVVTGLPKINPIKKVLSLMSAALGLAQSLAILLRYRPQAVIGTGGYVSLPPVLAARILRIPTLIHEQNSVPGKANRVCARFANLVAVNFDECKRFFPEKSAQVVGNPIRANFLPERLDAIDPARSRAELGLSMNKFTTFVLGGSRGAHSLNVAIIDVIPHLDPQHFQFICMTGKDDYRRVRDACDRAGITAAVFPFVEEMITAYTAADLMISRAGASALAEICAVGLPAILVPYPHAVDRHQELNARTLVEAGAAEMIINGDLRADRLAERIKSLAEDEATLQLMRSRSKQGGKPDAAERIVTLLFEMVFA